MIILEGPDGGGKTTLLKYLSIRLTIPIAPRVVGTDTKAMVDLKRWVEMNITKGPEYRLYDRHRLISEPIYGPILRNTSEPGFDDPKWLALQVLEFYRFCDPVIIYCIPPKQVALYNCVNGADDNSAVLHKLGNIYDAYCANMATNLALRPDRTLWYDYTKADHAWEFLQNQVIPALWKAKLS